MLFQISDFRFQISDFSSGQGWSTIIPALYREIHNFVILESERMTFSHKYFIICSLLFLPMFMEAQEIISNTSHKLTCRIVYHKYDDNFSKNGNAILREMAKDVLREPWLVRIGISCELGLCVLKDGNRNRLLISLRHPAIDGDTVYRKFPVTCELFPSQINMKLKWANRADTSGFTEETLSGKPMSRADSLICDIPVVSYDPEVDTLMVRDVELLYDSVALQTFFDRIALIHDYYASVSLLDSLQQFTANVHLDNDGLLPLNYLMVEEVNRVMERIAALDFPENLLRNGTDPRGLVVKYKHMFRHSRSMMFNFLDELHKTGTIPWNRDVDRLAMYFTSRVFSYVRRSFLMDQQQGRIYYDCLDHFFDHQTIPGEENVAGILLEKMFPDAAKDTIIRYISQRIYASYRITAQQLMYQNRYAEAYSMMENGRRFIEGNPSLHGTAVDHQLQSQAAEGICNSYIGIASSCIRSHKYILAETYLSKADQYAAAHTEFIRSDSSYRAVFSELFFLRNVDCDQLLEKKKYAEALDCFQQFEKAYSARDLALVSTQLNEKKSTAIIGLGKISTLLSQDALKHKAADTALFYYEQATALRQEANSNGQVDVTFDSLAPLMALIKYKQIFKEGAMALEKRQYTLAVTRLKEAKSLAEIHRIDRDREFDSLYRQAVKNWLIVQLSASQKKIWANQFDSAQIALQSTEAAGFDFGLLNDPDFSTAIEKYKMKIIGQQCKNLQDSIDLQIIRADRNAALKNFINASRCYNAALNMVLSDTVCHLNQQSLKDSLTKYKEPSDYQQNVITVNARVAVGDYTGAMKLLIENQLRFTTAVLKRFGLQATDVHEFISLRNNPYLTQTAASFYLDTRQPLEAFRFLLMLNNQHVEASQVKALQKNLGQALAKADLAADPDEITTTALQKYPDKDDWFSVFRTTYSEEREHLMKTVRSGSKQ